eukprot:2812368-Rhodomonas_salina.1
MGTQGCIMGDCCYNGVREPDSPPQRWWGPGLAATMARTGEVPGLGITRQRQKQQPTRSRCHETEVEAAINAHGSLDDRESSDSEKGGEE